MSIANSWRRKLQARYAHLLGKATSVRMGAHDARLGVEALEVRMVPTVTFVKDINPGPPSSNPDTMVNAQGTLFFVADDGAHGDQLWMSDGTTTGTSLVALVNPNGSSNPQDLTAVDNNVFFSADDGVHGSQLWMYNASTQTAAMVADINPSGSANPQNIIAFGSQVYFTANDGVHGQELWISDGTSGGTQMVSDINPGSASSAPADLTRFNSTLYFSADDGVHGRELWNSDGTDTVMVADIVSGSGSSNPNQLTPVGSTLYFVATTPAAGTELWQTDGVSNPQMTADILPGAGSSNPTDLTDVEDQSLYFSANDGVHGSELWTSAAGSNTASMVADINPGTAGSNPAAITDDFGTVLFIADDDTHGAQLWSSAGSVASTTMVSLINPNGDAFQRLPGNQFEGPVVLSNGFLVFSATDGVHGFEPWITDGSGAGTFMAGDINPGSASSFPTQFTDVFGNVFFSANDGAHGFELYSVSANARTSIPINFSITPPTSTVGQTVTMTVSVSFTATPDMPLPTGLVTFSDGGSNIFGTASFSSGVATLTTSALPAGDITVFADYAGDSNYQPTQAFFSESVLPGTATATTTTLTGNPNPSTVGQPVTFQVTVVAGAGTPGGAVDFFDGSRLLGASPLDGSGDATLIVSGLGAGTHTINALYEGSADFISSTGTFTQTVNPAAAASTSTAASGNPNPSSANQSVTLSATVTSASGTPTGVVQFVEGTTILGSAALDVNGTATLAISNLPAGANTITANYGGSTQFSASSTSFTQQVGQTAAATSTSVSGSPNPSSFGQSVTFTATVTSTSGTPTGTVDFSEGATDFGIANLNGSGQATLQVSSLAIGSHTITATFVGNSSFATSSKTFTQVVNSAAIPSTSTSVSGNPNPSTAGQSVTFTATVTSASGTPTGSVSFSEGATNFGIATLNGSGQATIQVSSLSVGSHTITATFVANSSFTGSSNTTTQVVNAASGAATTTTVSGSPNPSASGQSVTFTATVTSASGTPTGSVDFSEGSTDFGTVTLNGSGQATVQVSSLAVGSHTITATFIANASFAGSTKTTTQVVNAASAAATTTTVSGSPNPSTLGQSVTFTATVTTASGTPTGSVDFSSDTTDFGIVALNGSGQATIQISNLPAGSQNINATFIANSSFAGSSNTTTQVVNSASAAATTTTVSGSPNPSTAGQNITFTATVTSASGTPTGSVDFSEGSTDFGTVTLNGSGQATIPITSLAVGSHTITATFIANASFAGSSKTTTQVVNSASAATTTTTVSGSPNPSTSGQIVTFTATVTSASGTPTGSVDFSEGSTDFGTVTLNGSGQATIPVSSLAVGSHTITATFIANASFAGSSNTTTQVVNSSSAAATTTTVSGSPNPSTSGQSVTFTATVTSASGTPTGMVDFADGSTDFGTAAVNGSGQATMQVSSLAAGSHTITATYLGDVNFSASSRTTTQVVNAATAAATTTTVNGSPNPSISGQSVTFVATVTSASGTPTGAVDFSSSTTDFGAVTLNSSGQAIIQISSLPVGSQIINARFIGNASFDTSSNSTTQVVNAATAAATATSLTVSPNPSNAGQLVTFTATVISAAGTATGQVVFSEGTTIFGAATLNSSGQASIQVSSLGAGAHNITANYQATSSFSASSNTVPLTVQGSTAAPNALYVTQLYHDLLLRAPEQQGLDSWVQLINNGVNRAIVAYDIEQTPEYITRVINSVYQATLFRSPDQVGFANSVQYLKTGHSSRQLQALLQASPEYFVARGGNTAVGFVNSIYVDSLGRPAGASTLAALAPLVNIGYSRLQLAMQVATSLEADSRFVSTVYSLFLGRPVDAPSLNGWINFMIRGGQDEQVAAGILGSDEYFQRAQNM